MKIVSCKEGDSAVDNIVRQDVERGTRWRSKQTRPMKGVKFNEEEDAK